MPYDSPDWLEEVLATVARLEEEQGTAHASGSSLAGFGTAR